MSLVSPQVRQSIINKDNHCVGFELLSQDHEKMGKLIHQDQKRLQLILNQYTGQNSDAPIAGLKQPLFAKISGDFCIKNEIPPILYPHLVLEIAPHYLELFSHSSLIEKEIIQGLQLCIDDFQLSELDADLINMAKFIKIDAENLNSDEISPLLLKIKSFKGKIIFKNIESHQQYEQCKSAGGHYFQGSFLGKANISRIQPLSANAQTTMSLIAALYDETSSAEQIQNIIATDPILTTQLLKLINSAAFGVRKKIESIQQAILFLGYNNLRQWVNLILLSRQTNKSVELMRMNLTRAAFCKKLAETLEVADPDKAFLMGLLSMLNAYIDWPLKQLLPQLPISDDIKLALSDESGLLGEILNSVKQYESANWSSIEQQSLAESVWCELYESSMNWADQIMLTLSSH
ncbi:MAG: hypothetical protein COW84_00680 [Gammaproteobacteria bacterium CG22_combo_CG10-13_8_21_14_all_40_8]|nr:MAG: hypothetical protein COW84_00680 [Gammaproteobacteria bacterium CG22_combo_CG10-13_8_21_14_all_40_8]